jgi:hypothetical protein
VVADQCASATDVSVRFSVGSSVTLEEGEATLVNVSLTCSFPYDVIIDIMPTNGKVVTVPTRFVVPSGSALYSFPVWVEASDNAEIAASSGAAGPNDVINFSVSGLQGNVSRVVAPATLSVLIEGTILVTARL